MIAIFMAVVFGAVAILISFAYAQLYDYVTSLTFRVVLVSVFALFVILSVYMLRRNYAKYQDKIRAKGKSGEFFVAVSAVEESLERVSMTLPEVLDIKVIVFKDRKEGVPVLVRVYFHCLEDTIVSDVADKLRKTLAYRLSQIIGSDSSPNFELTLARITTKEGKKTSQKKSQEVVDLSKGPIYPIQ
jgi:hypothetical protein